MNGVSWVRIFLWGLESPPQVLNLNQGVAMCERKGLCFLIPTHHSWSLAVIFAFQKSLHGINFLWDRS